MVRRAGRLARRSWTLCFAALALAVLVGTLAVVIARGQDETRSQLVANFRLRGTASASLISTYLAQQAARQRASAEALLAGRRVSSAQLETVAKAFGAQGAVLVGSRGNALDVWPDFRQLLGRSLLSYSSAREAEHGRVAISEVLPAPTGGGSITSIAVPFGSSGAARRVFAAVYAVGGAQLRAFVDHAIAYPEHEVLLLDGHGSILAASPRTTASTVWGADLPLAEAIMRRSSGALSGERAPSTFTVASVPGTAWRIVLMVPDSKLFASISGITELISWLVFGLVTVLGLGLLALFARSLSDRARLSLLSSELEAIARTDPLTGLANRRGIEEDLAREFARTRRRETPLTALMIDLDSFKEVNDRHGHEAGDRVLVAVADCMRDVLRVEDVYGRVGGDEFVVVMAGVDEPAGRLAAERLEAMAARVDLSDLGIAGGIPMSIGVACSVHAAAEDLMRAADAELYRVKDARRARTSRAPAGAT